MTANRCMARPVALVLGPSLEAISGVTTHVNSLLGSQLGRTYRLIHFQVGSEGRDESRFGKLGRFVISPFGLAAAILRHDASIVHVNSSLDAKAWWRDLAYLIVAKLCGARVVLQKHGGDLGRFTASPGFAFLVRHTLKLADSLVVLSQDDLKAYQAFVPGQHVAAVPNAIDPAPYPKHGRAPADATAPLKLLYIGRLAAGKGLSESLEALALLRAEGISPRLIIAGSGSEETHLRSRVRELGLGAQVSFAGPARGEDKMSLLCNADVLLLPSYSEGLPYALLEGMAAGAVPIVTQVGAIPDVVSNGVHGLFVPVKDSPSIARAIGLLHADRTRLARMSQACRGRIASTYSLERLAGDFTAIYSGLLAWPASQAG
jgi:glycosyltransferase involved in cell wall biosynthesis